jgi:hypothetical protein
MVPGVSTTAGTPGARSTDFPPRRRGLPHTSAVVFVAACPACGADCEWREERHETRLHTLVGCTCPQRVVSTA